MPQNRFAQRLPKPSTMIWSPILVRAARIRRRREVLGEIDDNTASESLRFGEESHFDIWSSAADQCLFAPADSRTFLKYFA